MNSLDFCGECGVSIPCNTERYCAKCQQWIDMEARILKLRHQDESDNFYEIDEEEKVIECLELSYEDTWSSGMPSMSECYGSGRTCETEGCFNTPQEGETFCCSCWNKHI